MMSDVPQRHCYMLSLLIAVMCLLAQPALAQQPLLHLGFDGSDPGFHCDNATHAAGVNGQSLVMDEKSECDTISLPGQQSLDRFSLTLWANVAEYPNEGAGKFDTHWPMTLVSFLDEKDEAVGVLRLTRRGLQYAYTIPDGWKNLDAHRALPVNQWFALTVEFDGSNLRLAVNGQSDLVMQPPSAPPAWCRLQVARWGKVRKFLGRLDELTVFDHALGDQLPALIAAQNRSNIDVQQNLQQTQIKSTYGKYRMLCVGDDVVHPLVLGLSEHAVIVPWSSPQANDLLISGDYVKRFATRTALFHQVSDSAGRPWVYDEGQTLTNLPGVGFEVLRRDDGLFDLVGEGVNSPFDNHALIYLKNIGQVGSPRFAEPQRITIDGRNMSDITAGNADAWSLGDLDGDGIEDLIFCDVVQPAPDRPDGSFWDGIEKPNQGKGRGYDITGKWLGACIVSKVLWAKGSHDADGLLSFAAPKIIHDGYPGFAVQWRAVPGISATRVMTFDGRKFIVMVGDTDRILALPVHMQGDELYADKAIDFLVDGARLHNIYYPTKITPCDFDGDGQPELIIDGNPARITVLRGEEPGQFIEIDSVQQKAGPIGVDTLANPCREDWDGDGHPDLIIGDSSGYLTFWPGTANPLIYGEPVYMRSAGKVIQIQAGYGGSIQGPTERRWGYLQPTVADWDEDGSSEIITNDIMCHLALYRRTDDPHDFQAPLLFTMNNKPYKPAWRTRPAVIASRYNYDNSGLPCLLHMDWDGELAVAVPQSRGSTELARVDKLTYEDGKTMLMCGPDGLWGRMKLAIADWDGDGDWDILLGTANSVQKYFLPLDRMPPRGQTSPGLLENVGTSSKPVFAPARPLLLKDGSFICLGVHNATVYPTDIDGDGRLDIIVGAEDGRVYVFGRDELKE